MKNPYLCSLEADFKERNSPGQNLHLTMRFSDDLVSFGPIQIRIALSRAYINFELQNCTFPPAGNLEHTWPLKQKGSATIKNRSSHREADHDQTTLTASAMPSIKVSGGDKAETLISSEVKLTIATDWQHVSWRGSMHKPSLVFDSQPSHPYLSGTLLNGELVGSVEPNESSYYDIALELEVPKSGLLIEDGIEFKSYPNKKGLLKIIAANAVCRRPQRLQKRVFTNEN
jgi:hypothetical protein